MTASDRREVGLQLAGRPALVIAAVLVLGCVGASASPSPIGSAAVPSASVAAATASVAATSTPTPTSRPPATTASQPTSSRTVGPTVSPSASPSAQSLRIPNTNFSDVASHSSLNWSPTGDWVLVRNNNNVNLIRTSDMTVVRTYSAPNLFFADSTWIDAGSFFVYSSVTTDNHFTGSAWRGTVDSADLVQTQMPWHNEQNGTDAIGTSNGKGAVAFWTGRDSGYGCADCRQYQIWTSGGVTPASEGIPVAWSVDGTMLAVIHHTPLAADAGSGPHIAAAGWNGDHGWLEVLRYPSLDVVYSNRNSDIDDTDTVFSPSGRYLYAGGQDLVLNINTGRFVPVTVGWPTAWYGDDQLVTQSGRDLVAHSIDGTVLQTWKGAGDGPFGASPDGRLMATTDHKNAPTTVVDIRDGMMSTFDLPAVDGLTDVDLVYPSPANDARSIALFTESPAYYDPTLILQLPD
jgi:hypothetical protein